MSLILPENYPEMLGVVATSVYESLMRRGVEAEIAGTAAMNAAEDVRFACGGGEMYVPKGVRYELSMRDDEIYKKFTGANESELTREYGLTDRQIRTIIAKGRERDRKLRQLDLFTP